MLTSDMDAHGYVALLDTKTDEIRHVPAHMAQEAMTRNPGDRFKVLQGKSGILAGSLIGNAGKRAAQIAAEQAQGKKDDAALVASDATDISTGALDAPQALPLADTSALLPEQLADPRKAARVADDESKK